jgi:hypothetical protein
MGDGRWERAGSEIVAELVPPSTSDLVSSGTDNNTTRQLALNSASSRRRDDIPLHEHK